MPEPLTSDIISFHYSCYAFSAILQNLRNDCNNLSTSLIAEGNPSSGLAASLMAGHIWELRNKFSYGGDSVRYWLVRCLQWMDINWSEGNGEVTMDAILTAMLGAEYTELQQFIGIVDSYRVALWNSWFNTEFYAALARGFKELAP